MLVQIYDPTIYELSDIDNEPVGLNSHDLDTQSIKFLRGAVDSMRNDPKLNLHASRHMDFDETAKTMLDIIDNDPDMLRLSLRKPEGKKGLQSEYSWCLDLETPIEYLITAPAFIPIIIFLLKQDTSNRAYAINELINLSPFLQYRVMLDIALTSLEYNTKSLDLYKDIGLRDNESRHIKLINLVRSKMSNGNSHLGQFLSPNFLSYVMYNYENIFGYSAKNTSIKLSRSPVVFFEPSHDLSSVSHVIRSMFMEYRGSSTQIDTEDIKKIADRMFRI